MIKFTNLDIIGFGSIATPTTFNLNSPGLNILSAANGTGKSTRFAALVWAIFGKSLKAKSEIQTWEFKRPVNWLGTKVELEFYKAKNHYRVIRCKDYKGKVDGAVGKNRLIIYKNTEEILDTRDKRDSQALLQNIIGYSYELFTNAVIFPQKAKRFIEESGTDKRKMFEEVFDLGWIEKAAEKAKLARQARKVELLTLESEINLVDSDIETKEEFLTHVQNEKDKFDKDKKAKRETLGAELDRLTNLLKAPPDSGFELELEKENIKDRVEGIKQDLNHKDLDYNKKKLQKWDNLYNESISKIAELTHKLEHYETSTTCAECDQEISKNISQTIIDDTKVELNNIKGSQLDIKKNVLRFKLAESAGEKLRKELFNLNNRYVVITEKLSALDKKAHEYQQSQHNIDNIENRLKDLESTSFNDITPSLKKKLKSLRADRLEIENEIEDTAGKLSQLDWVISNPLSTTGLKTYIINNMIDFLNQRLVYYKKFIKFGIQLMVDMDLARKDIRTVVEFEDNPVLFEDLSGGEKQLIYIALAFGLADLLQDKNSTNIAVFDELFESLDVGNTEIIADLLQDRVLGDSSIFIITHKKDFNLRNAKTIEI